jgi:hypothetical protein
MFQFPASPVLDQIFTPAGGPSYKWNGTGWVPFTAVVSGGLTFTGPVLFADGVIGAPGISWANETTAGFWRSAPGVFNFIIGGQFIYSATTAAFMAAKQLQASDGTFALPGLSWVGEPASGFRRAAANLFNFTVSGVDVLAISKTGFATTVPMLFPDGTLAAPAISFLNDTGVGLRRSGAGQLMVSAGGVNVILFTATAIGTGANIPINAQGGINVSGAQGLFADGTGALPGIAFSGEPSTGFWRPAASDLRVVLGGGTKLQFAGALITSLVNLTAPQIFSTNVMATGVQGSAQIGASSAALISTGILSRGVAGAGNFGAITLSTTDGASSFATPYGWARTVAGAFGQHTFSCLQGATNSSLRIFGGNFANGEGYSLAGYYGSAAISLISTVLVDGTAGAIKSTLNFYIGKNAVGVGNPDFVMGYNGTFRPQFRILGSWTNNPADMFNVPFLIQDTSGASLAPGFCMAQGNAANAICWTLGTGTDTVYSAGLANNGPLGGWAANLTSTGVYTAAAFTPASDAALKSHVRPITHALAAVLKLRGVRYRRTFGDRSETLGLIAQEVTPIFPELVGETKGPRLDDPAFKTLDYMALTAPIIEAIRELNARLTTLEAKP